MSNCKHELWTFDYSRSVCEECQLTTVEIQQAGRIAELEKIRGLAQVVVDIKIWHNYPAAIDELRIALEGNTNG